MDSHNTLAPCERRSPSVIPQGFRGSSAALSEEDCLVFRGRRRGVHRQLEVRRTFLKEILLMKKTLLTLALALLLTGTVLPAVGSLPQSPEAAPSVAAPPELPGVEIAPAEAELTVEWLRQVVEVAEFNYCPNGTTAIPTPCADEAGYCNCMANPATRPLECIQTFCDVCV
jgi:hypothetical protein